MAMVHSNASDLTVLHTVRDLLRYAVSRLGKTGAHFGQGTDNAWDEAVYLLLHSLHLPLDQLDPFLDARVLDDERKRFLTLLERRCTERMPAAYLTNEAWLQGYRFHVDERVIIPRSPISELLVQQFQPWVDDPSRVGHILDCCTGSGCLAILAALAFEQADIDATDLSEDALAVARRNVADYDLTGRIRLHQGSLFADLDPGTRRYDLILCNPPYVNAESMQHLPPEFQHEPDMALAGGTDGMDLVRTLLEQAPRYLKEHGMLILEIGHEARHFAAAFPDLEPIWLATEQADDQIMLLTRSQLAS